MATCTMFTSSYITMNLFPIILESFRQWFGHPGGTFLIFGGVCVACALFVWKMLPETKDKTLEEIGKYWIDGQLGRKSTDPFTGVDLTPMVKINE
jgi:hypothetical protein